MAALLHMEYEALGRHEKDCYTASTELELVESYVGLILGDE